MHPFGGLFLKVHSVNQPVLFKEIRKHTKSKIMRKRSFRHTKACDFFDGHLTTSSNNPLRYDTLPAQVYISGTSVKKINFWCFNQQKYVFNFFSCFPSFIECLFGVIRPKKDFRTSEF